MNKKLLFFSHIDMIDNVAQAKMRRHMAAYVHTTWHTHMDLHVRVRVCMRECAYVFV